MFGLEFGVIHKKHVNQPKNDHSGLVGAWQYPDAAVPEVDHLIDTAMNTCLTVAWHSSYPWPTTQPERHGATAGWRRLHGGVGGQGWELFLWETATSPG